MSWTSLAHLLCCTQLYMHVDTVHIRVFRNLEIHGHTFQFAQSFKKLSVTFIKI